MVFRERECERCGENHETEYSLCTDCRKELNGGSLTA